ARADHRLAVTGFRQQLIDWQARVAEMRQVLTHDGTRLGWKQAEVEQAAREVGETSQKLARQSAELRQQERVVGERRNEVERHLGELLRSAELVDAETLAALLLEGRRQRRSLRQVLLSGRGAGAAALSLYQLALIEAGNFDGLVLGPLRVIDRLSSSPREVA